MSDFLSSLRGAAASFMAERQEAREATQFDNRIRQSPEYRYAAENRFGQQPLASPAIGADPMVEIERRRRAAALLSSDMQDNRGILNTGRDAALDVASGVSTGVLNLAALGLSGASQYNKAMTFGANDYDLGVPVARFAQKTSQFLGKLKSQEGQNAAVAQAVASDVITDENRANADRYIAEGGNPLVAGAGRILADTWDTGANTFQAPQALQSGVAQGVGSLLVGGPVAKGATALASTTARALTTRGLMSPRLATIVAESVEGSAMTATIAGMESGGAYSQAANAVMDTSHADLMQNSDLYARLINSGVSEADAKNEVASQAGTIAATIQAPVAAATGALVAKFEANPLAGRTVRGALQDIGKETVEEGVQSFSGQLASNAGVRSVDRSQDVLDGVGQNLAEGAIFGAGTAGMFAGPNIALGAAERIPAAVGRGVASVLERGRKINEANKVSPEALAAAVREAAAPVVPSTDPEIEANFDVLSSLTRQFHFDQNTYQPTSAGEARLLATMNPDEQYDIWDVITRGSNMISSSEISDQEKTDVALMMFGLYQGVTDEAFGQVLDLQGKATPGGTMANELSRIIRGQEAISGNPKVREAVMRGLEATPEVTVDQMNMETPEGQQAIRKASAQVSLDPNSVSPDVVEFLQHRATDDPGRFPPSLSNILRSTVALNRTYTQAAAEAEAMGIEAPNPVRVSGNVQIDSYDKEDTTGPSVRAHYDNVLNAMNQGNEEDAYEALQEFRQFAVHMGNKTAAVNESFKSRGPGKIKGKDVADANQTVRFDSYSPKSREWTPGGGSITTARFAQNSIAMGQQVGVDAGVVINAYNALAEQFPQLDGKPVDMVQLDPGLRRKPADIVSSAQSEQRSARPQQAQRQPVQPKAETAPVQQTVTEAVTPTVKETPAPAPAPVNTASRFTADEARNLRDAELTQITVMIDDRMGQSDERPTDKATLETLRAERARRDAEEALYDEAVSQPAPEAVAEVVEPEAKPEVQTTEATAEEVKNTPNIQEVFPNLIRDTNGQQLLLDGFTMDGESRTRLMGPNAISLAQISGALQSPEAFQALTQMGRYKINQKVSAAYNATFDAVINRVLPIMHKHLTGERTVVDSQTKEKKKLPSHFKPYLEGKDPTNALRRVSLRMLNFLERTEDGSLWFSEKIEQAAVLALSDWLAQASVRAPDRSAEDIARKLKISILDVTPDLVAAYNSGVVSQQAHLSLADTLTQFLGLRARSDVKNGLTKGLMLSLAGELLDSAEEAGLIQPSDPVKVKGRYLSFLRVNKDYLGKDGSFVGQTTLIQQIVMQDESAAGYTVGKPSGNPIRNLQRSNTPTTQAQNETAKRENAVPQTVNRPMFDLLTHLEPAGVVSLFANGVLAKTLNKHDRKTREGQNMSFLAAYDTAMGVIAEMQRAASEEGVELEETKIFREYAFSSVSRMQQQGQYGDQASKLTRELITPYGVVLDMTVPANQTMFRRAMAQAFGIKIEKKRQEKWEAELDAFLALPAIQTALQYMADPTATPADHLIEILKEALDPTGKKGVSPVQVHALQAYAELQNTPDPSEFFTHAYVEADGVTDGPTNSMIYMRLGGFDEEMVAGLRRGGLTFNKKPTALHTILDPEDGSEAKDTYEISGERLSYLLSTTFGKLASQAEDGNFMAKQADALMRLMRILLGGQGFSYTENEQGERVYTIGRNQLKNPLTVTVYGSSPSGIAAKIAHEMAQQIYQQISEANARAEEEGTKDWQQFMFNDPEQNTEFFDALTFLGKYEVVIVDGKRQINHNPSALPIQNLNNAVEFTISRHTMQNLADSLEAFYVSPMLTAIDRGMGSSVAGSNLIQRTTNFLSVMARNTFIHMVETALASSGSLADGLSPDEIKKIMDRVAFLLPYMRDTSITVNVKGQTQGQMTGPGGSEVRSAASFSNNLPVQMTIPMPAVAGVAGPAYVNISYGDGRMIIEASPNLVGGRLMVFDGINLALDNAERNGVAINSSVLKAIQTGTPFQDLNKTFTHMAQSVGLDALPAHVQKQIVEDLTPPSFRYRVTPSKFIQGTLEGLSNELSEAVIDEKARQAVLKRVHLSSDHMAALAAPASTAEEDRIDLGHLSPGEQAAELQIMFLEEKAKQVQRAKRKAADENLTAFVENLRTDPSGARVVSSDQLRSQVDGMKIPAMQKRMIKQALLSLDGSPWTIVFGSEKTANKFAKDNGMPFSFGQGDFGISDFGRQHIVLTNNSSETLAHELIHAATMQKVAAYYNDPNSLDETSREAVARLDILMDEWKENAEDFASIRNKATRTAVYNASQTIQRYLDIGNRAAALNEFMAWNLSNQDLTRLNSDIKVESTLARVARGVLEGLKKLFGFPSSDMVSNIRFNAMVLMRGEVPSPLTQAADTILEHSSRARPDLRDIAVRFFGMLKQADKNFANPSKRQAPSDLALQYGYQLAQVVSSNGFPLTAQERETFVYIVAAYRANMVRDPKLNTQMDVFMREVQEQLNQSVMMDDPNSQDPGDLNTAVDRINLLNGSIDVGVDAAGRSLLVPMFVALGATSKVAQSLFNRIEMRNRKVAAPGTNLDSWLKSHVSNAIDQLMDYTYGLRPNQKVGEQLQDIIASVVAEQDSKKGQLTQQLEAPSNFAREMNDKTVNLMSTAIDKANDGLDFLVDQAKGTKAEPYAKYANNIAQNALNIFHKTKNVDATSNIYNLINETEMPNELRALFGDILGVTQDNVDILQLVKLARSAVHRVRQTYRKLLPQRMVEQFKNKPTSEQWYAMHRGLGEADVAVLLDQGMSAGAVVDLLTNPNEMKRLMDQKEGEIRQLFKNSQEILKDATDLANMMMLGQPQHGFVRRNALAIANRAGEPIIGSFALDSAEVKAVDGYVSLLALSKLNPKVMKTLAALASSEREGVAYTLSQIAQARRSEMSRVTDRLQFNVPKGYMPYEKVGNMVAVPVRNLNDYTVKGYKVVGTRIRGPVEALYDDRAGDRVYVSTNIAPPSFKQGIMQTVRPTVFGLDAVTALSHDNPTAGLITSPTVVKRLTAALKGKNKFENLSPIFDEKGQVYAYERLVPRYEVEETIEVQRNAAIAVGQWIGRQFEEVQGAALNDVLIERLAKRWDAAKGTANEGRFVDLFEVAETDPIIADALKLVTLRDTNNVIDKMDGKFMVERLLVDQVLGYRSMSVGDPWTGNTRLSKEHQEGLANFLTGMFGENTYKRLTAAERAWTNLMGDARVAIVVKSVLVPAINGVANFYQLLGNGIGPLDIAKKSAQKLRETHLYAQNYLRHQALEADLSAAKGEKRPDRVRQIEVEMRKIEDLNKRLSIYPLIKAGEFTQVTEGLTQDDMELTQGRLWDKVSAWADKLPPSVKTAGRYAIVAKDTALFEGLARAVSYTDFVAKAVLYDHLTNTKKKSHEQALLHVTNEFVNYDLLGGRMRSKAEEVGLIWFWAFKLRSIKVAATMIRENPLHALMTNFAPGAHEAGTVFDDNALALFTNGRWDNSLGPDNALRALSLNPISQLF